MPQNFVFTSTAMAAALEDTPVSYEDLAEIEREFDDVDTEISKLHLQLRCLRDVRCNETIWRCLNMMGIAGRVNLGIE
jgi:hypothetical protein